MAKLKMPLERVEKMLLERIRVGKDIEAKIKIAEENRLFEPFTGGGIVVLRARETNPEVGSSNLSRVTLRT
jgi:hypothetical protein